MTCIIGLYNQKEKVSCLIGDRMVSSNGIENLLPYPKIIEIPILNNNNKILIGASGYLRTINIFQTIKDSLLTSEDILEDKYDLEFLMYSLVPRIKDIFKSLGEEELLKDTELLIGTPDGIFYVDPLGAVVPYDFHAIGSGKIPALTIIDYLQNEKEVKKINIKSIMKSIAKFSEGVSEKVDIFYTKEV